MPVGGERESKRERESGAIPSVALEKIRAASLHGCFLFVLASVVIRTLLYVPATLDYLWFCRLGLCMCCSIGLDVLSLELPAKLICQG